MKSFVQKEEAGMERVDGIKGEFERGVWCLSSVSVSMGLNCEVPRRLEYCEGFFQRELRCRRPIGWERSRNRKGERRNPPPFLLSGSRNVNCSALLQPPCHDGTNL